MKINATYVVSLILVLLSLRLFAALEPPRILCIALDENDDVLLTWSIPDDPGAVFFKYLIYYRPGNTGPFTILHEETNYNQDFAQITGSFSGSGNFFMVTQSNGGAETSIPSDTISPMILTLFSLGKDVTINWNKPNLQALDSIYSIYRRSPGGSWTLISQVKHPITTYKDEIGRCRDTVQYKVEFTGLGGCINRSNVGTKVVEDKEPPLQTNLISASVDTATGFVILEWAKSKTDDVSGYLVSYFDFPFKTDTVFGGDSLNFVFDKGGIDALSRSETLSIAPFDSCLNAQSGWYNQAADSLRFKTLFTDTADFDRCAGKVALKWNMPKDKFPVGVRHLSGFRVYRKSSSEGSLLRATLTEQDSVFLDSGLISGRVYTYVVVAFDNLSGKEAMSNKLLLDIAPANIPDHLYISSIVNDHETGLNVVSIFTDTTSESRAYGLLRAVDPHGGFQEVVRDDKQKTSEFSLIDESGAAGQTAYYYKIAAFDVCMDIIAESQVAKSIHLGGHKIEKDYINILEWTAYQGYDSAGSRVANYALTRQVTGLANNIVFNSTADFDYEDDIVELEYIAGSVCYYVEAEEDAGNRYGFLATSRSNLFCLDYPPRVFIPNAFSPDDDFLNDKFLPDVNFINPSDYLLSIYDRGGRMIFQTSDPRQGWDGSDQGIGVYAYHLVLKNARSEKVEFTGKVHLIR